MTFLHFGGGSVKRGETKFPKVEWGTKTEEPRFFEKIRRENVPRRTL